MDSRYTFRSHIGHGTFGTVSLYDGPDGECVVKETRRSDKSLGYPADFVREIDTLYKFRPISSVVSMLDVYFDPVKQRGFIVLERCETNLRRWYATKPFEDRIAALPYIIRQIGGALAVMHEYGYIHGDIKNNNILANSDLTFKLVDFGKSRFVIDSKKEYTALGRYCPLIETSLFHSELYAFCVVLAEMILNRNLISCGKESDEPIRRFYRTHGWPFSFKKYLQSALTRTELKQIPNEFWSYTETISSWDRRNNSLGIQALEACDIKINKKILEAIEEKLLDPVTDSGNWESSSIRLKCHSKVRRMVNNNVIELFDQMMNIFISEKGTSNIGCYAEAALVCLLGKKYSNFEYIRSINDLLYYQRNLLITLNYQHIVIN